MDIVMVVRDGHDRAAALTITTTMATGLKAEKQRGVEKQVGRLWCMSSHRTKKR